MCQSRTQILESDTLMFHPRSTTLPAVSFLSSYLMILALNLSIYKLGVEIISDS